MVAVAIWTSRTRSKPPQGVVEVNTRSWPGNKVEVALYPLKSGVYEARSGSFAVYPLNFNTRPRNGTLRWWNTDDNAWSSVLVDRFIPSIDNGKDLSWFGKGFLRRFGPQYGVLMHFGIGAYGWQIRQNNFDSTRFRLMLTDTWRGTGANFDFGNGTWWNDAGVDADLALSWTGTDGSVMSTAKAYAFGRLEGTNTTDYQQGPGSANVASSAKLYIPYTAGASASSEWEQQLVLRGVLNADEMMELHKQPWAWVQRPKTPTFYSLGAPAVPGVPVLSDLQFLSITNTTAAPRVTVTF